jgi:hypothetical protein
MRAPLLLKGMHGLGDNLHQRAIIRQLLPQYDLWLESSWVAPYVDLVGQGLKVVRKETPLRTQTKNAEREAKQFHPARPSALYMQNRRIYYGPDDVRRHGGVLAAICANVRVNYAEADFRLPVPSAWLKRADELIASWQPTKPILIYRPLVDRAEWSNPARNPDVADYGRIFDSIREKFFVISIADLVDRVEWMVSPDVSADVTLHRGELEFEVMAALFKRAALVFCSPGFAVILAQAVETPVISVFGHYERAYSFSGGARFSPYLGIEPINPRDDFRHEHRPDKHIDLNTAIPRAIAFASEQVKECPEFTV